MRLSLVIMGAIFALILASHAVAQEGYDSGGMRRAEALHPTDPQYQAAPGTRSGFSVGGFLGFQDGLSFQAFLTATDFAQGFPLQARLRLARTSVEPGSAPDARRIFINDATNGTPKENGSTWDVAVDGLFSLGPRTRLVGGVRYSRFKANFKYVGGNEDFDVTSSHWGLGVGVEAEYPMNRRMSLVLTAGGEHFFSSRLTGHDTSYSPDGDNVNPRKEYTYSDADAAVDQPTWRPVALVGVSYRLGR